MRHGDELRVAAGAMLLGAGILLGLLIVATTAFMAIGQVTGGDPGILGERAGDLTVAV